MQKIAKTVCPEGGLYVVEGEISLLVTAMRRGARWSSHSHQDEEQDTLMKGLSSLKETLHEAKHLSRLEPNVFLAPFLEIIRSEDTTGPVTSLALSAVYKFISYGLLDPDHPAIAPCVESIADAVTHARFIGTDASNDSVVFMKILQVLKSLVLSPVGDYLSNETICEILLSCFRISFETRFSELLRRTAEHRLRDMVQHLFTRLPHFTEDTRILLNMKKMRANSMDNTNNISRKSKNYSRQKLKSNMDGDDSEIHATTVPLTEKVKDNPLATTPVAPDGNIVDMQGPLNHNSSEKLEDKKNDNNLNNDKSEAEITEKEIVSDINNEQDKNVDDLKHEENNSEKIKPEDTDLKMEIKSDSENSHVELENTVTEISVEKPETYSDQSSSEKQENHTAEDEKNSSGSIQSPASSIEDLEVYCKIINATRPKEKEIEEVEEYVNTHGVRFTSIQEHAPYGALCVRELFRFLITLCSPLEKQNNEAMTHLGLSLLQVALEIAADALSNFPSLLALVKDDLCRNLILLLGTERLSLLAADLQVSFLLFESQRKHLKFQMENYLNKLMEIISSDSNRILYEQRELSLEAIVRLWQIPGFPAELYLNYDCGLYSTNLYEELMKLLSKNASAFIGNMYSMQFISLDAIIMLISDMEAICKRFERCNTQEFKSCRHLPSSNLPMREEFQTIKANKRWLILGTEKFNENPREGINKLSEYGLLGGSPGQPDPEKIAKFLKENPWLDKKAIGEYLSKKENKNVLNCFVHSFDLRNTRIDQALRLYLETFRLPGEAPLISLLLEKFADHWHDNNGKPFASADAAFTLSYAVIMLNVDQHNHNVKKQSNPMTPEQFRRNLKKVNGGANFDQEMLDDIYVAIRNEEIVMPAEQTGIVRQNYLWKVLLRRGSSSESNYYSVGASGEFVIKELAERAWAPIISALCRAYDKTPDENLQQKISQTFLSCAAISAHYSMNSDFDTLIVSLCKFTGLAMGGEPEQVVLHLSNSRKCQLSTRILFKITHLYGNGLRASWKNIVDCFQSLYKARLLPKSLTDGEDFIDPSNKVSLLREPATPKQPPQDQGLLSSLYSYIALDSSRMPHSADASARERATEFISSCCLEQIIEESKFLQVEALRSLVGALVSVNHQDEDISIFLLEILLDITIQNRDRVMCIWPLVQAHIDDLLTTAARENYVNLLERVTVGMLRLAIRLLRGEEFAWTVLPSLLPLTYLTSVTTAPLARQIAYGLSQLLKIGAPNIHSTDDWKVIFSLLECAGAGALTPKPSNTVLSESSARASVLDPRPISPVPEWVLISPTGTEAPLPVAADTIIFERDLQPHDTIALMKSVESLTYLMEFGVYERPFIFDMYVRCIRTFVEAVLQKAGRKTKIHNNSEEPTGYQQIPIQLLDLMHKLHTRAAEVFKSWAQKNGSTEGVFLWPQAWKPLLQGIARLCCDSRRQVRTSAITCLQSTLLAHDLAQLSAIEWSQCLEHVLFPLLAQLLGKISTNDPTGVEETRVRAAMLLSKVFLHHLTPLLTLPGFLPLWLTVLDLLRAYMHVDNSELLYEAIPESLKNMLLVMASANVLAPNSNLWAPTWRTIDSFLPKLKAELFPEPPPAPQTSEPEVPPQVISLVGQQQPPLAGSIAPQPEPCSSPQMEDSRQRTNEKPPDLQTDVETEVVPIKLPLSPLYDSRESQQVINLVNQPLPRVSSPVAIQPASQHVFDIYQPVIHSNSAPEEYLQIRMPEDELTQYSNTIQEDHSPSKKCEEWNPNQQISLQHQYTHQHIPYQPPQDYANFSPTSPTRNLDQSEVNHRFKV
ncbi:Golgi-specific brefeldin A-resistance guanine nucleotide exchange factor 1 [Prorops nasuta]|uniref:Golgi-specific brefeldin A-resistance guanine nucleotide exchange factor 1 n=1 Tax=Prorops nasuta TaxID=863751 RepID=UPI0034CE0545